MEFKMTTERVIWSGPQDEELIIGEDDDGLGLIQIKEKSRQSDGSQVDRICLTKERAILLVRALNAAIGEMS